MTNPLAPSSEATQPPTWLADASRLERFLVGPEVGQGGMGRVHQGWDPLLQRRVAIKLLHQVDPGTVLRLFQEAQNQARLDHPNICRIYELGGSAQTPFIAMQWVDGEALGNLAGRISQMEKVRLLAEVAEAIHTAHLAGLVHRDLKPSNILVEIGSNGARHPIIVDFGLAVDLTVRDQTLSWGMAGTPAFMSPEQAQGLPLSPAADIYSLGATLFALLLGRPPFEATTLAGLLTQQASGDAPRLRQLLPEAPRDLQTVLGKALETLPSRRYATALELAADLRRFLAGVPVTARPIGMPGRFWRRVHRHQGLSLTLTGSLLLLATLGGWTLRQRRLSARQLEAAQQYGWEVKNVETVLRLDRLLPPHDLAPVEAKVAINLDRIRREMQVLGSLAQGPGHYALGRGSLILQDPGTALKEFQLARQAGLSGPALAYAEALAHAGLYESQLSAVAGLLDPHDRASRKARLIVEHRDPALAGFRAGRGVALESPSLGEARVAFLEGGYDLSLQKCEEALQATPGEYEAAWLASQVCYQQARKAWAEGDSASTDRALAATDQYLTQAQAIARSDPKVVGARLQLMYFQSLRQSESGQPNLQLFQEAHRVWQVAHLLRPNGLTHWRDHILLIYRELAIRLNAGEDCRAWLQQQFEQCRQHPVAAPTEAALRALYSGAAEARWRFGEDPRPDLEQGLRRLTGRTYEESEMRVQRALFLSQHGGNPQPDLDQAAANCRALIQESPRDSYLHTVWAKALLARSEWQEATGQDPDAAIRQGIQQAQTAIQLSPEVVYPYQILPLLQLLQARRDQVRGGDPWPALEQALAAAQSAVRIRGNHWRSQWVLGECHRAIAQFEALHGRDPRPALAAAQNALNAGLALNARDFRLHLAVAQVALDGHRLAPAPGQASRAERAARTGLRTKADAPELWLALAEALHLQGSAGARQALGQAQALVPAWPRVEQLTRLLNAPQS